MKTWIYSLFIPIAFSLGATAWAGIEETKPPAATDAQLQVNEKDPFGTYLTDAEGMSLYLFMQDPKGQSTCYEACTEAWPPLTTEADVQAADPAIQGDLIGLIQREDGTKQVTYGGWPLYYFYKDKEPGDTLGQDVEGFGAEWYLISPDGTKITAGEGEHEHEDSE